MDPDKVPFPVALPGLGTYAERITKPERFALDWFHMPHDDIIHPHLDGQCNAYFFEILYDSWREAIKLYTPLYFVTTVVTKFHPVEVVKRVVPAVIRSSIFLSLFTAMYARCACFLFYKTGVNSTTTFWVSPFLMSLLAIPIEKPARRRELAVYVANQSAETVFKMLLSRGYFGWVPIAPLKRLLLAGAIGVMHYFYNWNPKDLAPSMRLAIHALAGPKGASGNIDWLENAVRRMMAPIVGLKGKKINPDKTSDHQKNKSSITQEDSNGNKIEIIMPTNNINNRPSNTPMMDDPMDHKPTTVDTVADLVSSYYPSRRLFIFAGFVRGFLIGYLARAALSFLPHLFNPSNLLKNFSKIISKAFGKGSSKVGLFISLIVGLPRLSKIILSHIAGKDHPIIDIASGMLGGGIGSLIISNTEITMYLASKAGESVVDVLMTKGYIPHIPYGIETLFAVGTAVLFYCGSLEPWTLRPSYRKFLARGSGWHYGRLVESDGCRALRLQSGKNELRRNYYNFRGVEEQNL